MSDILKEHKVVEKSIADSVDRLGYVFPDRIQQFTDLTYTEVANFSFLLTRAKQLKDPAYFPFSRTMITKNERGEPLILQNYLTIRLKPNGSVILSKMLRLML